MTNVKLFMNLCFEAEEDRHCNLFQNNHPVLHLLKYFFNRPITGKEPSKSNSNQAGPGHR